LDNNEGTQPESMKPKPGKAEETANTNGVPSETERAGLPPVAPAANLLPYAPSTPAEAEDADGPDEEPGFLTPTNLGILGILIALIIFLVVKFTPQELWYIVKAGLGLSFVIFVHELGHFLAAKWCDVNVTTFSIGFGPAIPGCKFKWGETTYKLAILPLGGYVQMVGQVDGDEASDGSEDDPRSYRKKTVPQRMLIISAGVIMNAIFAAICFIAVYQGNGKEHPAPVIGVVDSGATSFIKGLRTDARITEFSGNDDPTFTTLTQSVINSGENERIPLAYQRPGHEVVRTEITALDSDAGSSQPRRPVIGVQSASKPQMALKGDPKQGPYFNGTPAAKAEFKYADVIVAMTDPDIQGKNFDPKLVTELPDDPNYPKHDQRDYGEFMRRLQLLADKNIIVRVRRGVGADAKEIDLEVAPIYRLDIGVRMQMGRILAVREGSDAADKIKRENPDEQRVGDKILAVSVKDADGKTIDFSEKDKTLDPERLPQQLRQWSDRLARAKFKGDRIVTLLVQRHQLGAPNMFAQEKVEMKWDTDWRFDRVVPLSRNAPMPIPELGLAYQIKAIVDDKTRAGSPLEPGDVITHVRAETEDSKENDKSNWGDAIDEGQWSYISRYFSVPIKFKKLELKIKRGGKEMEVEVPLATDEGFPIAERGWLLASDTRRVKASDPAHAVWLGLKDTYNRMTEVFLNIRGMLTGRISVKNFGGPITIAKGAYLFAKLDTSEFLFFLGLISINLAVVNFLPIPILDGGHMVFLIYEKIRGKPASEAVRVATTYIGLVLILCLMIFVLTLDVLREL
jgi:regulator of sigma E protease